jgi:ferredoxin
MGNREEILLQLTDGIIGLDEIRDKNEYPSEERFKKGPVPIIECIEEIPCNPCETVCKRNLITVGKPITNYPGLLDIEAECTSCAQCIVNCPGLAIFIVDKTFSETEASVSLPYEQLPFPKRGKKIKGINRSGKVICEGNVHSILTNVGSNQTNVVTIVIPKEFAHDVKYFRRNEM